METISSSTYEPIEIRKVFAEKSPVLARIIPGFVYKYLARILQLDFINDFLKRNGHLTGIDFVERVVSEFEVTERIFGLENLPENGRFIFASNHPLGGFDGMLLMRLVYHRYGEFKSLSNDILMNISNLKPLFVPVNKHGGHSRNVAHVLNEVYKSDQQIMIFPSGLASRKIKGKVEDLEWKKHFISKALEYKRDVIPVYISGRNSNRFYRIANIRKFFRIKWNLEMFLLPDETIRHKNTEVRIIFGKPLSYTMFDKSKTHPEWAQFVRELVYHLPDEMNTGK